METQRTGATSVESLLPQKRTMASYSEITLTDEETAEALRLGRKEKYHRLKEAEWREKLREEKKPRVIGKDEYREILLANNPEFNPKLQEINQDGKTINVFDFLLDYFTTPQKKGLLFRGGVGCGKTTLVKMFMANPTASYGFRTCREISEAFTHKDTGGYDAIRRYYDYIQGQDNWYNQNVYGIAFDDLGEEKNKKHYGNEENVMEIILLSRYQKPELWSRTHITTNLTSQQIEEVYGSRVRSRMREMFTVIDFTGIKDLRK